MASERVLVTGASGFVGSHVTRHLVRRGYEVHALARPSSDLARLDDIRRLVRLHAVALSDRSALRRTVHAIAPRYVIHLAGAAVHAGLAAPALELVRTNLLGTINLIDACEGVPYAGFVNTGDAFEYGPKRRPAKESDHCRPRTLDGMTKLNTTLYARYAALALGKPIVTLRLFSVFGPMDHPRRLVPQVMECARRRIPLRASSPAVARDYLYVEDAAELYLRSMAAAERLAGEVLNAGSGRSTSVGDLVKRIDALTGRRLEVHWGEFPLASHDRGCWVADMTKTRTLLRWKPKFSFEQGLRAIWRLRAV